MIELNKVLIVGRLTRDPEIRHLNSGGIVADLSIAVNRRWKDKQSGEWKEEASFFNATVWNQQAEFVKEYFKKGTAVFVEGKLKQDSWEQDGQKRSKVVIVADRVSFAESKKEAEKSQEGHSGGTESEQRPAQQQQEQNSGAQDDDLPF